MFNIQTFDKLNSTNKYALEHIKELSENTIISAKVQENGRGRFNRKWISDKPDNCYISFVLKPDLVYQKHFANLTQYLSVVLCRTLEKYKVTSNIKWPNDVQINGKKIAGILSEVSFEHGKFLGLVLGIGVNLNLTSDDLSNIGIPATSLNLEIKNNVNSTIFIQNLCDNFYKDYELFLQEGFSAIRTEYISKCNFLGKEIQIKNPDPQLLGIAKNICEDGSLEVFLKNGELKKILSGDVIAL